MPCVFAPRLSRPVVASPRSVCCAGGAGLIGERQERDDLLEASREGDTNRKAGGREGSLGGRWTSLDQPHLASFGRD